MEMAIWIAGALAFLVFILLSIALMRAFDGRRLFQKQHQIYHPWWIYALRTFGALGFIPVLALVAQDQMFYAFLGLYCVLGLITTVSGENAWNLRFAIASSEKMEELAAQKRKFKEERKLF